MDKLLTSGVSGAIKKQPLLAGSVEFMQNSTSEILRGVALSLIGINVTNQNVALIGCTQQSASLIENGFIYYNGEVYYFNGINDYNTFVNTGVFIAATTYISPDPITYSDGTTGSVHQRRRLRLVDQADGTGLFNFSALTYVNDATNDTKTKIIQIGDWDMDTNATKVVAHGLTVSKIRSVNVNVIEDSGVFRSNLDFNVGGACQGAFSWDATNVNMNRLAAGVFDTTDYNATGFNRGFITIHYVV